MANLQFDALFGVAPPPEVIPELRVKFARDVDTRSVIFDDGLTLTFSNYMTDTFEKFFAHAKDARTGPSWIFDGWATTTNIIKNYKLGSPLEDNVAFFLLGRMDALAFYQEFSA